MFVDERSNAVNKVRQSAVSRKQCRGNARTIHKSKYTCAARGVYEIGQYAGGWIHARRAMADIGIVVCNSIEHVAASLVNDSQEWEKDADR